MDKLSQFLEMDGFTDKEKELNAVLAALFADWLEVLRNAESEYAFLAEHFVSDGFYPRYTEQRPKILFIGRESHGMAGHSATLLLYNAYRERKVNGKALERHAFHKRLLKVAYGLTHGCCPWAEIPRATDLAASFGKEGGLSFAFMNLCKISNEAPEGDFNRCNQNQMFGFLEATRQSGRNFLAEEIDLLDPEVIIAMNFADNFFRLGHVEQLTDRADAHLWRLTTRGKSYPLIDTYHFAAPMEDQAVFYDPVVACVKQAEKLFRPVSDS